MHKTAKMATVTLKEDQLNKMILNLMDNSKKENTKTKQKKIKKNNTLLNEPHKEEIKKNLYTFLNEQEQICNNEKKIVLDSIKQEIDEKEKELNAYYAYCQKYKESYKDNFDEIMKNSEELKNELKELESEYLDNKQVLENKRKAELENMVVFYKEKLIEVENDWKDKYFLDDNMKKIVFEIMNLMKQ